MKGPKIVGNATTYIKSAMCEETIMLHSKLSLLENLHVPAKSLYGIGPKANCHEEKPEIVFTPKLF
jgi:hypothetical protein